MATLNFSANGRYSANEAIDNFILGGNLASKYTHKYITNEAVPCCDMENKVIYSPVLPSIIDNEMDTVIRGKNEHEAGHGRFTPANKNPKWSRVKGQLVNALEDERIEKGVKSMSKAFESDIDYLNRFMIDKLNTNWMTNGCTAKPIDEAIMALHIRSLGFNTMWQISTLADKLISSVENIYVEIKGVNCDSVAEFDKVENIADRILAVWQEVINNEKNDNQDNQDNQDGNNDSQDGQDNQDGNNADESGNNDNQDGNNADADADADTDTDTDADTDADADADTDTDADADTDADTDAESKSNDNQQNKKDDKKSQSNKVDYTDGDKEIDLDQFCDGEDLEDILKKELQNKINDIKAEIGNYTAYTAEDEIVKSAKDINGFDNAYKSISGAISMLASYMEQSLRTQSRCRNIGNRDKGYLDRNALPLIAKNLTKNIFYTKRQGVSLDTTVSILIDESGSMWGTHLHCRCMAIALAEVLERLEIKFEILGHTTGGIGSKLSADDLNKFNRTKKMIIFEHKNFNESYRNEKYRLGSIGHYNCNADSEALLTTFKRAMEQKSSRHIIMVLSDGCLSGAKTGGEKHLCKVVDFCRKNGAEVYAFGIGTDEPKQFYGDDNFVYLKSADELNGQFFRQLSNIIIKGGMC